jgi:S-adenosyl methyltransferase
MTQPEWVPDGVDLSRPSVARVYDYFLGGFHNFPADREMAEAAIATYPALPAAARAGRAFLARAVTHLAADHGVRQFLDLGSGIPTVGNVHEIAQAVDPAARVVYVDIDPVAVAHSEALLAGNPWAGVICGDLRQPEQILDDPVARLLDPAEPVAVLMSMALHFVRDDEQPTALVRRYRDLLGDPSWLVLSHVTHEFDSDDVVNDIADLYARTPTPIRPRTRAEVATLLAGYDLVDPGLVLLEQWRPGELAQVRHPERFAAWAGVARAS